MSKEMMKLLNPSTGEMECRVCGRRYHANLRSSGRYFRGSWQCPAGCRLEDLPRVTARLLAGGIPKAFQLKVGPGIPVLVDSEDHVYRPGDFAEILSWPAWAEDLLRWAGYQF
jgi:hypothetical protein